MKTSESVQMAISSYVNGAWTLNQIENWAIEFGDNPVQREDSWSMEMAGQVLVWLIEIGQGLRTIDEFDADMRMLLVTSAAAD